ncbi:DNA repair protein endonuclease SAE2/CtIP C-terminus-domain-containing protein [Trametes meyenii]|nr:DNA repair protein endonuclease SAE2/CtIP C-terminus-domain-containing protein [Trametes meyenii]
MPRAGPSHTTNKQVQFLENKVNKLRWVNDDLNKQVFEAVQRGHRLAAKLGYHNLEEAEGALTTQPQDDAPSQLEQLSQFPTDELAAHVQDLQSELNNHVQLSKSTLSALGDALQEMSELREENLSLRGEIEAMAQMEKGKTASLSAEHTEVDFLRAELAALKKQCVDLQQAKERNDTKHAHDYVGWRNFKIWMMSDEAKNLERPAKRRKLSPPKEEDGKENEEVDGVPPPEDEWEEKYGHMKLWYRNSHQRSKPPVSAKLAAPILPSSQKGKAVLGSRNLNASSATPSRAPTFVAPLSKLVDPIARPPKQMTRDPEVHIPQDDHPSSETEAESQPITFLFPSQIDTSATTSTIPRKRPRSPELDQDSSETEVESQGPTFLYPSQIVPYLPQSPMGTTPTSHPAVRRAAQLWTPLTATRPQPGHKGKAKENIKNSSEDETSSSTTTASGDPFRPVLPPPPSRELNTRLPETPMSIPPKKGKGRMMKEEDEGDENAVPPPNTNSTRKKGLEDYSVYKGRGRYGGELQAGKDTINALYTLDPVQNEGVGFQYEEVVRDKQRRKNMHAVDCECCRDYYKAVGPLPPRATGPAWRSPDSTPSKPPRGDSFGADDLGGAAIEEHKHAISRHRQNWPRAKTPPGYWNIGFPDTQEVAQMNAEAVRMHEQKRAMVAQEAARGGRFKKR